MNNFQAKYTFLPWLRQGLARQLQEADALSYNRPDGDDKRAAFELTLEVYGDDQLIGDGEIRKTVELFGPGDITGLAGAAIRKTEPRNGSVDFEGNYFPFIELHDEDLPWRYTPAAPNGDRLRPWLMLVVLEEGEFEQEHLKAESVLPSFHLQMSPEHAPFPPHDQIWAWAHVQVNTNVTEMGEINILRDVAAHDQAVTFIETFIKEHPTNSCSRILCPRKLRENTQYTAFLIPSFEKGRLAGLGAPAQVVESIPTQMASWGHDHRHLDDYGPYLGRWPYYFMWKFKTGPREDFESLVRKIKVRQLPPEVGKRWIDIQDSGYKIRFKGGQTPMLGAVQMAGPLQLVDSGLPDLLNLPTVTDQQKAEKVAAEHLVDQIEALVNLEEDLKQDALPPGHVFEQNPHYEDESPTQDDPILTPPFYGRWHALVNKVDKNDRKVWFNQLNLDPRHRAAAGLGAEVIRQNQEIYMQRAWQQFGDLFRVNHTLRHLQFAETICNRIYEKHLVRLTPERLVSITTGIHGVVKSDSGTVRSDVIQAAFPTALLSTAAEKIAIRKSPFGNSGFTGTVTGGTTIQNISIPSLIFQPSTGQTSQDRLHELIKDALSQIRNGTANNRFLTNNGIPSHQKQAFFTALKKWGDHFEKSKWDGLIRETPPETPLPVRIFELLPVRTMILATIFPSQSFGRKRSLAMQVSQLGESVSFPSYSGARIMKHPRFNDPVYEELVRLGVEHFVANLDLVPDNTFALMEVNRDFIESFLVGLNYEMARELLWREFPTDQRGSYFTYFWNKRDKVLSLPDIAPIDTWNKNELGKNGLGQKENQLAFLIRGDLLRRYPNTVIYLQKAVRKTDGARGLGQGDSDISLPIFFAKIDPDIYFIGFDITASEARQGEGFFFVVRERPGENRFGLDYDPEGGGANDTWDKLSWADLPEVVSHLDLSRDIPPNPVREGVSWGFGTGLQQGNVVSGDGHSAKMAWILQQKPVLVAVHISQYLPDKNN